MWRKRLEWAAIAAVVGGLSAVAWTSWMASQDRHRREAEAKVAAANYAAEAARAAAAAKKQRPTFDLSPADLIDRYNAAMKDLDRAMLLPPISAMRAGGSNPKFHAYNHQVAENMLVTMEVDNETGRPFSLGMAAAGDGKLPSSARIMVVMAALGLTFFERGDPAGVLVRTCVKAIDAKPPTASVMVEGFEIHCASIQGVWMGGITVPSKT